MTIPKTENSEQLADILGIVVDDYLECRSRGEHPEIEQIAQQHPELADILRQSLRALEVVGDTYSSGGSLSHEAAFGTEKRLGDFRILHELGRGGMGVVYEAEQISMGGRKVALKVLPFAAMVDEKRLQRFRNEVRAAASLDHPNIVSVYSVGEERGVHFYAMQLIRGQSLASLIEQLRDLRQQQHPLSAASLSAVLSASNGQPSSTGCDATQEFQSGFKEHVDPSTDQPSSRSSNSDTVPGVQGLVSTQGNPRRSEYYQSIAELGIQAAEALDFAHQQGVVHRDIKPANLMIDAKAKLYITDFGLAQMEENVGITMTGDIVGTLRYMSPEQALGKRVVIDQRADVYALGISLYELLITEPAFDGENRATLLKQIAFQEPRRLRQIDRSIPRDLETIIHKAIAKNPDERYASAQALADDLRAFHDNQPIAARPPSFVDRSRKWTFRNQGFVLAIAIIMLLTTVGLAISNSMIAAQRNAAQAARDGEKIQRKEAEENSQRAKAEAERADRETAAARTEAAVAAAVIEFINTDLLGSANPDAEPNRDLKVREVLNRAAQNIERQFKDQPLVAAAIQRTLGRAFSDLGEYDQAERHLKSSQQLVYQNLGIEHVDSLLIDQDLARLYSRRGQRKRSAELFQSLLERASRTRGDEDAITLSVRSWIANRVREDGRFREAEKLLSEVLEAQRRVLGPEHRDSLTTMHFLGAAIDQQGRHSEAEQLYRSLLEMQKRVFGPEHPLTLETTYGLAFAILDQGRSGEAQQLGQEVLEIDRRVFGREHPHTIKIMEILAGVKFVGGAYTDAEQLSREILEIELRTLGPEHSQTLTTMHNLARTIRLQFREAEGERMLRELLEIARRVLGPEHPLTLDTLVDLAASLSRDRSAEAEKLLREVIDIQRREYGPEHPRLLNAMGSLATVMQQQGRFAEAEQLYREVLEKVRSTRGTEHRQTMNTINNLANAVRAQGRHAEAEQLLRELLEIKRRVLGPEHPDTLNSLQNLAVAIGWTRSTEAAELYREGLAIRRRLLGPDAPMTLNVEEKVANTASYFAWNLATNANLARRDPQLAVEFASEATQLRPDVANHWSNLGVAHYRAGQWQEAVDSLEKADELQDDGDRAHRMFLAMAYWQLGERERAKKLFTQGAAWIAARRQNVQEQQRFRAEAEQLLGLTEQDRSELIARYFAETGLDDLPDAKVLLWAPNVEFPDKDALKKLSRLRNDVVSALKKNEKPRQVVAFLEAELLTWKKLQNDCDDKSGCLVQQLDIHHRLGHWLEEAQQDSEAAEHFGQATEIFEKLAGDDRGRLNAIVVCLDQHESLPGIGSQANDPATSFHQAIGRDLESAVEYARKAVQSDSADPVAWHLWSRVAFIHFRTRNWQGAEQDARLAIKLAADKPRQLFDFAPLLLLSGKHEEYQQFCLRLLDDLEAHRTADAFAVVQLCVLDPKAAGDPGRVLRHAQQLDGKGPPQPAVATLRRAVAMAHFRAGNYQEGIELLQQQTKDAADLNFHLVALQLAISHHYEGDQKQAREGLDNAIRRLQDWDPLNAYYRVEIEVLRREAESLILGEREPQDRLQPAELLPTEQIKGVRTL